MQMKKTLIITEVLSFCGKIINFRIFFYVSTYFSRAESQLGRLTANKLNFALNHYWMRLYVDLKRVNRHHPTAPKSVTTGAIYPVSV